MRSRVFHAAEVASSTAASTLRAWRGTLVSFRSDKPAQPLELFDFEACPYCRPVREALTELDIDPIVRPCPKRGRRHRARARELSGRERFPTLHDPNTETTLTGSREVLDYLFERYAGRTTPARFRFGLSSSRAASVARHLRGAFAVKARENREIFELYSFESSPFSRLVRERLCELELDYRLINMGKEQLSDIGTPSVRLTLGRWAPKLGGKREALIARGGRAQVPYLVDPNTGTSLYESRSILDYLDRTYALG